MVIVLLIGLITCGYMHRFSYSRNRIYILKVWLVYGDITSPVARVLSSDFYDSREWSQTCCSTTSKWIKCFIEPLLLRPNSTCSWCSFAAFRIYSLEPWRAPRNWMTIEFYVDAMIVWLIRRDEDGQKEILYLCLHWISTSAFDLGDNWDLRA